MTAPVERLTAALTGRYEIERELGQGGMATVYLAQDVRHHRKVALKVLRPELSAILGGERFLHEIRTTANLQHPHILPLHDSGTTDDGTVFYVMPYVQGESLRQRIDRDRQLPVNESVRIASEVASALDYAHRQGVIHRDIKPENILLHDGQALVADFGIALAVSAAGGSSRMTETGMSLGTPHYMSPEQAMGERDITARSDIYALGCVLYEMLIGEPPFTGPTAQAIIARVVTEEPRSLRLQRKTIPENVDDAVQTALSKIPADRFPTAAQFADALGRADYASSSTRTITHAASRRPSLRHRILSIAPWAVAAVAVAALLWSWTQTEPEQPVTRNRIILWQPIGPTSTLGRYLAISPDGRTVVYGDTTGGYKLWLKEPSALNAVPMPGTEGAVSPSFSPDGQWIAFTDEGKLMKIPKTGGSKIVVTDSAGGWSGVAWLDNGTILYGGRHGHLLSVSDGGGPFRTVLEPDSGRGVASVSGLPGGKAALVTICRPGCDDPQIVSLDLQTGRKTVLVTDAVNGWLLDGNFIFVRPGGGVFAAPFDRGKLSLSGPPVPLFDGVRANTVIADMALSPAGTALFIAGAAGRDLEEVVWVSRTGSTTAADSGWSFERGGNPWGLLLSPDGRRLAVGARVNGRNDIWIKEFDGGALRRLTFEGSNTKPVAWTPDGSSVIYTSITSGSSDLRMRRGDGTGVESVVVNLERGLHDLALTPDPAQFIVRTGAPPSRDLLLYRGGKASPLVATKFEESAPTLSRDGRWLAYVSDETGADEVYVTAFPDVNAGKWQVSRAGGRQPYWAHNGRELFYVEKEDGLISVAVVTAPAFRITGQRKLFSTRGLQTGGRDRWYDVAPDDSRFIFPRRVQEKEDGAVPTVVLIENLGAEVRKAMGRKP